MAVEESNLYPQKEKTRCRICYEVTEEGYPLRGKIPNVDTDIADMLTYCTLVDLDEIESLPTTVCTQCFKTLRIAYIFIKRFKETNEWLVDQLIKKELTDDHMYTKSHNTESSHDTADNDLTTEDMRHSYEQDIIDEELIEPLQEHEEVQQDNQQIQIIQIVAQEQGDVEQFEGENMEEHNTLYMVDTTATDNIITISNYEDFENLTEDTPELEIPDEDDPKADQENEIVYGHQIQQQLISYLNTGSGIKAEGEEKIFINPPKFKFRRRYHKQYVCPKCPDERLTDSEFYHHIVNHGRNRDGMFQCNQCDLAILMNAGEFYEHCMKMHRYHCVICNESFGKRGTHYAHMRRHSNIRYAKNIQDVWTTFFSMKL
ncbi:unnamed protein product [Acanthoscelides obtectus]|uniref:Uncharacterized protein n=1 Tax=Acanthoscelides obtectus TaxID=200917 RepID=A0A9P0LBN9_ACAOB|nr:unnamed protein product [Acanthoscelides obtectus]CAK1624845.1 hypothetical protein AOBTE_LOCUS2795 [Acanthoscelides obtectus]